MWLKRTTLRMGFKSGRSHLETPVNMERVYKRRRDLERRRILDSHLSTPPVEPTPQEAISLYRLMLKMGNRQLELTDKTFYKNKLRYEFEVTARQTSSRVRGMMYEKGKWMTKNKLGGLL